MMDSYNIVQSAWLYYYRVRYNLPASYESQSQARGKEGLTLIIFVMIQLRYIGLLQQIANIMDVHANDMHLGGFTDSNFPN